MGYKCIIKKCRKFANYNYKTCFNAAYCYCHISPDMVKFGKYDIYDFIEFATYGIGLGRFFTP